MASSPSLLVVISGPSGVGKDAVLSEMKRRGLPFSYVVTVTTRPRRPGEQDGVDYYFVSESEFQRMARQGELIEWAKVYGNYYGVPRRQIEEALRGGNDTILKVDVQGAASIKEIFPDAVFIFLLPPSLAELANRLLQRQSLPGDELDLRLAKAKEELRKIPLFDYAVVSRKDELDVAVSEILSIITAEKCRIRRWKIQL